jgi:hypothetical protein
MNDPLRQLILSPDAIRARLRRGTLVRKFYIEPSLKGKWAVFHGKTRLTKLYRSKTLAYAARTKIMGLKVKCWDNERIFKVIKL